MSDHRAQPQPTQPAQTVVALVAAHFEQPTHALLGPSQQPRHAWPRQVAMAVLRRTTAEPPEAIARAFGRDPGTVRYSIRKVERRCAEQERAAYDFETVIAQATRALASDVRRARSLQDLRAAPGRVGALPPARRPIPPAARVSLRIEQTLRGVATRLAAIAETDPIGLLERLDALAADMTATPEKPTCAD